MYEKGRAWIELNMESLAYNVKEFQRILPPGCVLMPAVKAEAYGHGACLIGRKLSSMGIRNFCVASLPEAVELREAGIEGQILILGYTSPEELGKLERYRLTQTVVDYAYAGILNSYGRTLMVHVGIDTGMHRLGERSECIEDILRIWEYENLNITGVFSHLCVSDGNSEAERLYTLKQMELFQQVVEKLYEKGICDFKTHMQGSYGVLNYPEAVFDYARIGIALYGVLSRPHESTKADLKLKPVLSLKARVTCVKYLHSGEAAGYGLTFTAEKEMKLAVVSIGYADGIPRELSNKGHALIKGRRVSVVGRVCMDQLLVDVSEIPDVFAGEEVVFIGKSGAEEITAEEMAEEAGTISNEILSRLGGRLKRIA